MGSTWQSALGDPSPGCRAQDPKTSYWGSQRTQRLALDTDDEGKPQGRPRPCSEPTQKPHGCLELCRSCAPPPAPANPADRKYLPNCHQSPLQDEAHPPVLPRPSRGSRAHPVWVKVRGVLSVVGGGFPSKSSPFSLKRGSMKAAPLSLLWAPETPAWPPAPKALASRGRGLSKWRPVPGLWFGSR